eukprot:12115757-Alexandrium_andersonii.AAC.1
MLSDGGKSTRGKTAAVSTLYARINSGTGWGHPRLLYARARAMPMHPRQHAKAPTSSDACQRLH